VAHFRKRQTIGVRNFWCESNVVAKGVCVPLGRLSVPQRDSCGGASLKWKCQNPKFSDIKAIPRAAHPVATPRFAPRDCAATVTQINKSENAKTILGWLVGWLMKSRMLINAHFLKLFTSKRRARGIWLQKLPRLVEPRRPPRKEPKLHPPTQPPCHPPDQSILHCMVLKVSTADSCVRLFWIL
jgi:hypothetical protein